MFVFKNIIFSKHSFINFFQIDDLKNHYYLNKYQKIKTHMQLHRHKTTNQCSILQQENGTYQTVQQITLLIVKVYAYYL